MSSANDDGAPEAQDLRTIQPAARSARSSHIGWWLASALFFGSLGILLVGLETQGTCFGERPACGLGNPPCSPAHPTTIPCGPTVEHPFAWVGALLIGYAVICLICCLFAWFKERHPNVGVQ